MRVYIYWGECECAVAMRHRDMVLDGWEKMRVRFELNRTLCGVSVSNGDYLFSIV